MTDIDARSYLNAVGTVPTAGVVSGCLGGGDTATPSTSVSDQSGDITDFDTCFVQIDGIRVRPEGEELRRSNAETDVDLTGLVGDAFELSDETELDTGSDEYLQLDAAATKAPLSDGGPATADTPGNAP